MKKKRRLSSELLSKKMYSAQIPTPTLTHCPDVLWRCRFQGKRSDSVLSSRRRQTRYWRDWNSDVCSSDLSRKETRSRQEGASSTGSAAFSSGLRCSQG